MGCCGCCSEKSRDSKDNNNEYEKIERNDSKVKTVLTGGIAIVLIAELLFLMI